MVDFHKIDATEPPATKMINDEAMQNFKTNKLVFDHPCHNQAVELITEASMHMAEFERREVMI